MKMRHRLGAALLSLSLLFTAGCSNSKKLPENPAVDITTEAATADTRGKISDSASLVSLRQAMVETPALFAVAYFGYPDLIDPDVPMDPYPVMQEQAPDLCRDLPFLMEIPEDRVIGSNGDLFCIVPLDADATVSVSKGTWNGSHEQLLYETPLYFAKCGEPILLFCNNAGFEPDTQLCISGPSGDVIWYPQIDDNGCAMPLKNDNGDDLFLDFSPYREMLIKRHVKISKEWDMPTAEMLAGTTWVWDGCLKDGRDVRYQVEFEEELLSVRWNDGIDAEDHVYRDAPWELTYEDGFAVLSIDFREMAGILRYNLLHDEEFEMMYFGMDAVQEEMPIGWEPMYRYLWEPEPPEPVEMLGRWDLAWTEVEGDRSEAEPGACSIEIQRNASSGLLISYTSREFPEDNFENALLTFHNREMYYGCGNDAWVGDLDYIGPWDTTYTVTLTTDDILIKQNHFLIDGAPMVSYEFFCRAAG